MASGYPTGSRNCRTVRHRGESTENAPGSTAGLAGSVRRRDTCVLGHQADRRHAPRQLHRGRAPLGRRPARGRLRRPRSATTRIFCVVDLHALTMPYDPAELTAATRRLATLLLAAGPRSRALPAVRAEPRARPRRAHVAAQLHGDLRRAAAHDAVQGEGRSRGRRRPGVGVGRVLRLPGADGRRHPALRHRRGPRRRRPAPARGAHPRHRAALQPPVRRRVHDPEGDVPAGRRARHGPPGPDAEDVEVGGVTAGNDRRARRREGDHEEDQVGGHRLRHRGAPRPRRQARRVESHRDPRRGDRPDDRRRSRRSSATAATGTFKVAVAEAVVEYLRPVQERYEQLDGRSRRGRPPARGRRRHRGRASPTPCSHARRTAAGLLPRAETR